MEIAVDKCRCCQCWELTFLDQGCVKVTDRKMYMYGHFDRDIGDILKITTKAPLADEINSCWEITAGPDNITCDPGTVQSERGVHVANCADHCPDVAIPILGCWVIESCSGLGTKTVSTDLSAYNLGDVLNLADSGVDCWKIIEQVPCPEDEPRWVLTDIGPALADCAACVPPTLCCTCLSCDYEITSNESADIWDRGWANSYLGFQRHIFNSATSQQPEFIRHKPSELLKFYTCNEHGAIWRGKFEKWLLRSDLTSDEQGSISCPGPMEGGELILDPETSLLFHANHPDKSDEVLVSVRKDCQNGNWLIKFDQAEGVDLDGWDKGYPTRANAISEPFFIGYQVESPPESDTYYSKDQAGGTVLAGDRSDMCCGGEIKVERNCPPYGPVDQVFYLKGTIDVYADQCGCTLKHTEMPPDTSTSVDSTKVFLDVSPP